MKKLFLVLCGLLVIIYSCNRKTADSNSEDNSVSSGNNYDAANITYEDPFKNQPTEFCTVIRKLTVNYYEPERNLEDINAYPKKYCLLDVCIDKIDNQILVINLGDSIQSANAIFSLIKVFDSYEETKAYEIKYGIKDVVYEEEE